MCVLACVCVCMRVCVCVCVCVWFLDVHREGEHMEQGQQPVFERLTDRKGKYMQGFRVLYPFSPTLLLKDRHVTTIAFKESKGEVLALEPVSLKAADRVLTLESKCGDHWEEGFSVYSSDACR